MNVMGFELGQVVVYRVCVMGLLVSLYLVKIIGFKIRRKETGEVYEAEVRDLCNADCKWVPFKELQALTPQETVDALYWERAAAEVAFKQNDASVLLEQLRRRAAERLRGAGDTK